jgi:Glycosyl hydrolase catalytic core
MEGRGCRLMRGALWLAAVTVAFALLLPNGQAFASSPRAFNYCAHSKAVFGRSRPFMGIGDDVVDFSTNESYQNCSLGWMASVGIGYFRAEFDWGTIEPLPGQYDLSAYDGFVANAARHHISLLGLLNGAPSWASTNPTAVPGSGIYPPANPAQFAAFATLMAQRYGPRGTFWREYPHLPYYPVRAWEIWNEEDLPFYWAPKPNMRAYVQLLKDCYTAIRRVNRHAFILSGGMPFFAKSDETHFISALYRYGGGRYFNALAIHAYSTTMAESEQHVLTAREVLDHLGHKRKPIWVTEVSWAGGNPDAFITNPRRQRRSVVTFFTFLEKNRARLHVQKVFWFMWQDHITGSGPANYWGFNEGLVGFQGHPKPALSAFAAAARRLDR